MKPKRDKIFIRLEKICTSLWPRSTLKVFGSQATSLSLPNSDLDLVISLPSVHKVSLVSPSGILEGVNAIEESWQEILARRLKQEPWCDQKSIKIIASTAIRVVKLKNRQGDVLLDISFDDKNHNGLRTNTFVLGVLKEMPLIRPLVLIMKQFLSDRALLLSYSGGLSSHCLFLMITAFVQQTNHLNADLGSLLLGFFDFFGNSYNAQVTGISVSKRRYFNRAEVAAEHQKRQLNLQMRQREAAATTVSFGFSEPRQKIERRHSFGMNENENVYSNDSINSYANANANANDNDDFADQLPFHRADSQNQIHHRKSIHMASTQEFTRTAINKRLDSNQKLSSAVASYNFDPIFVEDPLQPTNNVGRNAFRIFQILRAFSDAHRSLLSSLEFSENDDYGGNVGDEENEDFFPLLDCLLSNDDLFIL